MTALDGMGPFHAGPWPCACVPRLTNPTLPALLSSPALYRDVEAAEKQCKELEKVVTLIENNRQRFRHIDNVRAIHW